MIFELRDHLKNGLRAAGLTTANIFERQAQRDEYKRGSGAYLFPVSGDLERRNKPITRSAEVTTREQFSGTMSYLIEFVCRSDSELESAIGLFLRYLLEQPLVIGGTPYKCPSRPVRLSWLDDEGVLVDAFTTRLEITAETALLEGTALMPVTTELSFEIEGGNINE